MTRYDVTLFSQFYIIINAISSCHVNTNSFRYVKLSESEINYFNNNMKKNIPLGRIAEPDDIVKAIIFLASKRSSRITGQIIKVDGGRSLTTSGYVHYKGLKNMNMKFEPDYPNLKSIIESFFGPKKVDLPIKDENKLKKFIEETISTSNFSTRDRNAHLSVASRYYKVEPKDELLSSTFLKGIEPSKLLLEKIGNNKFGALSYNPVFAPHEFPKKEKNVFYSQGIKEKNDEENNSNKNSFNFNINYNNNENGEDNNNEDMEENNNEDMKENNN